MKRNDKTPKKKLKASNPLLRGSRHARYPSCFALTRFAGLAWFIARSRMPSEASAKEGHLCITSILSRVFLRKVSAIWE